VGENVTHLRPIHSEADYDRMVALMNALLEVTGDDEDHPLSGLLALVALTVSKVQRFISVGSTVFPKRCGVLLRSLNYHFWD
jgi:predicted Kef-type K+ transport protein